ncbi:PIN domain-like family protein, putative isoform 3 [Theobroma cacao]|uniref:PIN domain-like family protein, putative isoform 3 n=1 Tax=Theobroma cacao TaxID=3641 RepID=A0A061EKY4_THECC|nr:PIN domain-like family protein, putative isoform 3 [Theobroma cacao]
MRFKKQKRHRKTVRFFSVCFEFRQPFKVLCDGTFVHHLLHNDLIPADKALSDCLSAPVKLFTTSCVLAELKTLGASQSASFQAARKLAIARCDHEKRVSADACIAEVIGENNSEHFFVATQDADLRKKLQKVPKVPLIFGLRNALFLEPPSKFQREFAQSSEEKRLHMTDKEYKALEKRTTSILANADAEDSSDEEGLGYHSPGLLPHNTRNYAGKERDIKDRVRFKRKKAKVRSYRISIFLLVPIWSCLLISKLYGYYMQEFYGLCICCYELIFPGFLDCAILSLHRLI